MIPIQNHTPKCGSNVFAYNAKKPNKTTFMMFRYFKKKKNNFRYNVSTRGK